MHDNSLAYGVSERLSAKDSIDEMLAELRINGYTILPSGFPKSFMDTLKIGLDRTYERQAADAGGEANLHRISDANIARCMLAYDPDFLRVATAAPLMELARRALGPEIVLIIQNGIINRPDTENYQAKWHRDLTYQHWTSTKPLAINALLCVDDFTLENGATFVVPGTHHVAEFPTDQFVKKFERQLVVPAGSYLVLDAMVFHRAGVNRSTDLRRAVNHVIGLPFMGQQVSIPSMLEHFGIDMPADDTVAKYLGYRWAPAATVQEWRSKKLRG